MTETAPSPALPPVPGAATEAELLALLDRLSVAYTRHAHPPLFTVEQSREFEHLMPGLHTKNLFLKEKKGGFWLISCRADRVVRVRDAVRAAGGRNPSFGKEEDMTRLLGVRPGAVTPFGLLNDKAREVRFILDSGLAGAELVNFHPLHNEATLGLHADGLMAFLEETGHPPALVDLPGPEEAEDPAG